MMNYATAIGAVILLLATAVLPAHAEPARIKLGIDVLRDANFAPLTGKRVGLVANPASVDSNLISTADLFAKQSACKLVALFGPEHGLYADEYAGDHIDDRIDPRTGLPIYSLYGTNRIPTTQMVQGIDAFVVDLQDIGARSYTYVGTMRNVMKKCAQDDLELIILDRPNPLGGVRIEGPDRQEQFSSLVNMVPTPYVHGMTMGELAQLLRDKLHPEYKKLTIIKMERWKREMTWADTGLSWVPTSPQIPQARDCAFYVATGIVGELLVLSNGVGYTLPFEVVGAPWIDGDALAGALNDHWDRPGEHYKRVASTQPSTQFANSVTATTASPSRSTISTAREGDAGVAGATALPISAAPAGVRFRPIRYKPYFASFTGEKCQGVHVHLELNTPANLTEINFKILQALDAPAIFGKANPRRFSSFDKVCGSPEARKVLMESGDLDALFVKWRGQCEIFRETRGKYLLY